MIEIASLIYHSIGDFPKQTIVSNKKIHFNNKQLASLVQATKIYKYHTEQMLEHSTVLYCSLSYSQWLKFKGFHPIYTKMSVTLTIVGRLITQFTCLQIRVCIVNYFLDFSSKTYVVGTQKNSLNETVLLSTQNTCLIDG